MPVIILTTRATVPEPSRDRKAQQALWVKINALVDAYEAGVAELGGISHTDHASKREPGAKDLTPPPAKAAAPETDMVTIGVEDAAADPALPWGDGPPPVADKRPAKAA